jgi:hypothetical protein
MTNRIPGCSRAALSARWRKARRLSAATTTLFLCVFLSSCIFGRKKSAPKEQAVKPTNKWGYFSGPVDARWEGDGRMMTLLSELRYTDPKGVVWIAPAGSEVDGASIPRALWPFFGGPFEGKYRNASVLHDVAYAQKSRPWQQVDRMFYDAMRCSGVGVVEAKTFYYALYRHGRHWKFKKKSEDPRATEIDPREVDAIQQWIRQNDPSLDQIESRAIAKER